MLSVVFAFLFALSPVGAFAATNPPAGNNPAPTDDAVTMVMCNIIVFTKKLGMPIITGVILGSSIMAIFGKFGWGAIVMLVVFTAVFFGSEQIIGVFVKGLGVGGANSSFSCDSIVGGTP